MPPAQARPIFFSTGDFFLFANWKPQLRKILESLRLFEESSRNLRDTFVNAIPSAYLRKESVVEFN